MKRPIVVGVAVVAVVGAAVVIAAIVWRANAPGPASVDDAVEQFDPGDGDGRGDGTGDLRPPEGVYEYAGEGSERISFPPVSQQDGAVIPGTVTHGADGCWVFRLDYNAAHWQDWRYCPVEGVVADTGGRTHQTWDFGVTEVESLTTFECDPPGPLFPPGDPGWTVQHHCEGSSDQVEGTATSAGSWRYVGPEAVTVAGADVDAWHLRQERTISGAQEGYQTADFWFRDDGLLLRSERAVEVRSPSPIGAVTYTESGTVELTGLEPRT